MLRKTAIALSVATLASGAAALPTAAVQAGDIPVQLAACKAACGACNPCAVKKAACGACNPCAAKKAACGACNPCAVKKAACGACNPCKAN